ncbi:hypothetical protein SK128_007817 [Halocaridina rubra]|uniref:Uncharacterized protein n=1 Tax=Halocaridina rubra TaxID=373956 RepID=A0AAN8WI38_HALRR
MEEDYFRNAVRSSSFDGRSRISSLRSSLSKVAKQIVEEYFSQCYLALLTSGRGHEVGVHLPKILNDEEYRGILQVDGAVLTENSSMRTQIVKSLKVLSPRFTCRVMVIDVTKPDEALAAFKWVSKCLFNFPVRKKAV